jgi:hypothetical protein
MEKDKTTIHLGHPVAHCHSGLPGLGPTHWPSRRPLGQPTSSGAVGVRLDRARRMGSAHRRAVTTVGCTTWRGTRRLIGDGNGESPS